MELFFLKFKRAFRRLFGFSFFMAAIVLALIFSSVILLNIKRLGAFAYVYVGDKFYQKSEYQESIDYYNRALELFPGHVEARYNLGNIYAAYEDYDSAINCYKEVLKYDSKYINARINLGIILAEEKTDFDAAIAEYTQAAETKIPLINIPFIYDNAKTIKTEKAIAYYNMGLAYKDKSLLFGSDTIEARNCLLKAIDSYTNSLKLRKGNYDTQYNLALTYHLISMYTDALKSYCRAMLIAPLNYEAYYNMAILLRQQGKYAEAADEFRRAGNLSSIEGDTYKAAFIYSVLNEVSTLAIAEHGFEPEKVMDRLNIDMGKETSKIEDDDTRVLTVDDLEKVLVKRIKTGSVCKAYLENN